MPHDKIRAATRIDTLFGLGPSRIDSLIVSLDDPDGFIAAVGGDRRTPV
jgi:hypothetical protein